MPVSPSRLLRLILAFVLCLQSGLAMAHCLRLAAPASHQLLQVAICSPDGIVTIDLADGDERPAPQEKQHVGFCLACHGVPQARLPTPPYQPTGPPHFI